MGRRGRVPKLMDQRGASTASALSGIAVPATLARTPLM
jgi:hypothetical protein